MPLAILSRSFKSSLRVRVFLLTVIVFAAVGACAYLAFNSMVDRAIIRLGTLFAEKQVLYDRYRGLETLFREASLAETLARAPTIHDWARDEDDPEKRARGIAELEHYRQAFRDGSYFFVIHESGNYYFNNKANEFAGNQLRYRLTQDNPRDGWYFKTIQESRGCQLNVDHDDNIRVTKVWVNCKVVEDGQVLGIIGTGIDLTDFIREVVNIPQIGVDSMFIDHSGAIQAHRDPNMIDFHSLTKDLKSKNTLFALLDRKQDGDALARMMEEVSRGGKSVASRFVTIGGKRYLAGIGYLEQLGWYNVSLMDVDRIIERDLFMPIAALLGAMLVLAAALVTLLFKRSVLDRLSGLEKALHQVEAGDYKPGADERGGDEISRLSRALTHMAKAVGDHTHLLEALVKERTARLEKLANHDSLTELYNRRGFLEAVERERNRAARSGERPGLLIIDLDDLKKVNDSHGHKAGDMVLIEVGRRLSKVARNYDVCGRWGGDEFVLLAADCDSKSLRIVADKILAAITSKAVGIGEGTTIPIAVSIGACLTDPARPLDHFIPNADTALYEAKRDGRGRAVIFEELIPPAV
ncbi:diguanylate cyclase [Oceanibaculum nanhaiense]|uniref:sensor domain-containing diguanylate cyclase n=1 Tax=Oceanibaculum nanhaiense TaxID=1909734 RepID=UPI00396DC5E8